MCGISGLVAYRGKPDTQRAVAMSTALEHRGPDDLGLWTEGPVALCHRRLAIVDLSPNGHQPMLSANQRWVLSYNGEIYNGAELKQALAIPLRGTSDTEILIEAIAAWGVFETCRRITGMFSFAAFDKATGRLYLVRDRMGIKPLYYGRVADQFVFASELHALRPFRSELTLDHDAIAAQLVFSYVPGPASIYQEIKKLTPGTILELDTQTAASPTAHTFWDPKSVASLSCDDSTDEELIDTLHNTLRTAVGDRMVADVPLGAFLSGGYDSSLVCALMQEQANSPIKTFTIGFTDPRYNEADHARAIADHLGTQHTELIVTEKDLLDAVDQLPRLMDEPFADASILPTFLVSKMARQHVSVTLSGDGGDELFWGYHRYFTAQKLWRVIGHVPDLLAHPIAAICKHRLTQSITAKISAPAWGGRAGMLNQKLAKAGALLAANKKQDLYESLLSHWEDTSSVLIKGVKRPNAYNEPDHWTQALGDLPRMAWQDTLTYLPDDILTKVDRASMAVSLEARVPLLDHRVVAQATALPDHLKIRDGQGKYALRRILSRYIPPHLTDRPKMGFGVPLETWLRGPLRDWAMDLINPARLADESIFVPETVTQLMHDHQNGIANNAAKLWDVLMVQVWLETHR